MININGVQGPLPPKAIEPSAGVMQNSPVEPAAGQDVVEISTVARLAAKVHDVPSVRADLVAQVKAEIAAGTYETPERLETAVERLMDELFPEV